MWVRVIIVIGVDVIRTYGSSIVKPSRLCVYNIKVSREGDEFTTTGCM
jgi:hypothetical protein